MQTLPEIKPIIIGRLAYHDHDGSWNEDIKKIFFMTGITGIDNVGRGSTAVFDETHGTCLMPVSKIISASGKDVYEPLKFEGYAGLCCCYDKTTGTLSDFYVE